MPSLLPPRHLIWLQTSFIGDAILLSGSLELASLSFPHAKLWLITNEAGQQLYQNDPRLSGVFVFKKRRGKPGLSSRALRKILAEHINRLDDRSSTFLLQVHQSFRSSLLALTLCRLLSFRWISYANSPLAFLSCARVERVGVFHEVCRSALLLEPIGVLREKIVSLRPKLYAGTAPADDLDFKQIQNLKAEGRKILFLSPGSQWKTKMYPIYLWRKVLSLLLEQRSLTIVILGSPERLSYVRN